MLEDRIAFIGLGAMGEPMAKRLVQADYQVRVFNRSRSACDRLIAAGADRASSAREATAGASIVITMLPDGPDVEGLADGDDGLLAGLSAGTTWIEMSTIAPSTAEALAKAAATCGAAFLDAPVSGGTIGARDGTLTVMVGGDEESLSRVLPVLAILGDRITHIGSVGSGQIAKAANQLVVGGTIGLVAEALVFAETLGASPARVREALLGGFASSRVLEVHGDRMLQGTFEPGFRCALQRKDLTIVRDSSVSAGLELKLAESALELFERECDRGGAELDHSAAIEAVRNT